MKLTHAIHIGIDSASIARMEAGEPIIIRSSTLKDTIPMAVFVNRRGAIIVGDAAMNALKSERLNALRNWNSGDDNSFAEFTRTLGSDSKYESSNAKRSFSSEELLAEVLKQLISYERDFDINAAVLTVPAAFKINQINAVRKAGYLAGLKQIEILQDPVAAAMAYILNIKNKDGYWLVFDFGILAFDAALLKVSDGIIKIIDTEGNQFYGSSLIDEVIVNEIIIPHLQENFKIQELLADDYKNKVLRNSMKFYAEEIKKQLSFSDETSILSGLGDIPVEDDEGNELELDMSVSASELEKAISPVFQKAIDMSLELLKRNNLDGSKLNCLILAGKPTYSPILRGMLFEQICEPDTSIDPETVIVKGAAIYASTIDLKDELKNLKINRTKIQLEIGFEPFTNETEEFVTLKLLEDKTEGKIPDKVFAEIKRGDNAWSSGKLIITKVGEVFDVQINELEKNNFIVELTDEFGNKLECEPNTFSIQYGFVNKSTLPYNIGTEVTCKRTGKIIFRTIRGLEKNQSLPATGTLNGLKTQKQIRPGMDSDFIKIPIYQGEHGSEGTRAIYNEHVYDIIISGTDLPALLPENSDVDLTINLDKSQQMTVQAYFPYLDHTSEIEVPTDTVQSVDTKWLSNEIRKAKGAVSELKRDGNHSDDAKLKKAESELEKIEKFFENNKNDVDGKQEVLTNLRKTLKTIDELIETTEWPKLELQIISNFNRLEKLVQQLKNDNLNNLKTLFKEQTNEVIRTKDIKLGNALLTEMIGAIERIEKINEKYNREYLQLYESGEMSLIEVKDSLEEANRQDGVVYQEVLKLINNEEKRLTKNKVEDLLFALTENERLPGEKFGEYFERLFNIQEKSDDLEGLFKEIKGYE